LVESVPKRELGNENRELENETRHDVQRRGMILAE